MRKMKRYFNTAGRCRPDQHYMVNLDKRLSEIKKMVDRGDYFVINRGRQYGKTTTLFALAKYLRKDYVVAHLDFQILTSESYKQEKTFSQSFAHIFVNALRLSGEEGYLSKEALESLLDKNSITNLYELFCKIRSLCKTAQKPIVLMVDEVDEASNYQVFCDFLTQLRASYLNRKLSSAFKSVIFAGVYDIRDLDPKPSPGDEPRYNIPWNIAARFKVDMDFSPEDIESMLQEYEADTHTGMDISKIAQLIYDYTSGYPFLVSDICKELDEGIVEETVEEIADAKPFPTLSDAWTEAGIIEAVHNIVSAKASPEYLFQTLYMYLDRYPKMRAMLREILFEGAEHFYLSWDKATSIGSMLCYIKKRAGKMQLDNRIFEMKLYNTFLAEDLQDESVCTKWGTDKSDYLASGELDMKLLLEKFVARYTSVCTRDDETLIEKNGRKEFLYFLRPVIFGIGRYYIDAETRRRRRTVIILDYQGQRYVIEMKIRREPMYHDAGEKKLTDYLNQYGLDKGYRLTFSFIKGKQVGVKKTIVDGKIIVEATV